MDRHRPIQDLKWRVKENYEKSISLRCRLVHRWPPFGRLGASLVKKLKRPAMFGFAVYSSIEQASDSGKIPCPSMRDKIEGGHAVVDIGYDVHLHPEKPEKKENSPE